MQVIFPEGDDEVFPIKQPWFKDIEWKIQWSSSLLNAGKKLNQFFNLGNDDWKEASKTRKVW